MYLPPHMYLLPCTRVPVVACSPPAGAQCGASFPEP